MPLHMIVVFLIVVGGIGFALSAYTLSHLASLLNAASTFSTTFSSTLSSLNRAPSAFPSLDSMLLSPFIWGASAALLLCYFIIGTRLPVRGLRGLGWLSASWMGYLTLLLSFGGVSHLIEWTLIIPYAPAHLPLWSSLTLMVIHLGWCWGLWGVIRAPALTRVEVRSPHVDAALDGFTIVQLSDVHIGPTIGARFIEHLHQRCATLRPDLIVMTGDLVDGEPRYLGPEVDRFLELSALAPHGMYMITGNHEYISGASAWVEYIKARGVTVLENAAETLNIGESALHLIGIEDWDASRFDPTRAPSLERALANLPTEGYKLLLAHQPKAALEASARGVDLQLSGHTHGGQVFPFNFLIYLDQPYNVGRYQLGGLTLYVSPGTGYWGPTLRIGTRAEITQFTLRALESST